MADQLNNALVKIYYKPRDPGSYGGVKPLLRRAKELGHEVNEKKVKTFLEKEDPYTIHKPIKRRYGRQQTLEGGLTTSGRRTGLTRVRLASIMMAIGTL